MTPEKRSGERRREFSRPPRSEDTALSWTRRTGTERRDPANTLRIEVAFLRRVIADLVMALDQENTGHPAAWAAILISRRVMR